MRAADPGQDKQERTCTIWHDENDRNGRNGSTLRKTTVLGIVETCNSVQSGQTRATRIYLTGRFSAHRARIVTERAVKYERFVTIRRGLRVDERNEKSPAEAGRAGCVSRRSNHQVQAPGTGRGILPRCRARAPRAPSHGYRHP